MITVIWSNDVAAVVLKPAGLSTQAPAPHDSLEKQIREQFAPQNQRAGDQMRKDPMLIPVSLTADNMPMQKVLEKLASGAGLKVEFDVEALKQVEIDLQQPITLSIENLPFN